MSEFSHGEQPSALDRYADQAHALAASFNETGAVHSPDPSAYRNGAKLLSVYFDEVEKGVGRIEHQRFALSIDSTVSAFLTMYIRDSFTHQSLKGIPIGDHPADEPLERSLSAALAAQKELEANGVNISRATDSTSLVLDRLIDSKLTGSSADGDPTRRSLRTRAAEVLRDATRSVESSQEHVTLVARIGNYAAQGVFAMADIVTRHDEDTGDVGRWNADAGRMEIEQGDIPLYKDALARDMTLALTEAFPRVADT